MDEISNSTVRSSQESLYHDVDANHAWTSTVTSLEDEVPHTIVEEVSEQSTLEEASRRLSHIVCTPSGRNLK